MTGHFRRLVRDPLHQIAVGAQRVGAVVHDVVSGTVEAMREPTFRQRHAHGVGHPLAERSGRGLHRLQQMRLRMAGGPRPPLPEVLDLVEGQVVSGEMEERIEKHRGVPGRQDEAVPVGPAGIGGIVPKMAGPEEVAERRQRHGCAGVPGAGSLDRVHRKRPNGVDAQGLQTGCRSRRGVTHARSPRGVLRRSSPSGPEHTQCDGSRHPSDDARRCPLRPPWTWPPPRRSPEMQESCHEVCR